MLAQVDREDLDRLTQKEAEELHARLSYRLAKNREFSSDEQDVWQALNTALQSRGMMSLNRFVEDYGVSKYREAVLVIMDYLTQGSSVILRRPVRIVLLTIILECLSDNLQSRGIPSLPKVLLNSVNMLPFAVEEAFPGYAAAKMLPKLAMLAVK